MQLYNIIHLVQTGDVKHFVGRRSIVNERVCSLPLLVRVAWLIRADNDSATYTNKSRHT